jgi:phage gpG-like protein
MNIILTLQDFSDTLSDVFAKADYTPFYRQVGKLLYNATVADNFETDGAYFNRGTAWEPLADSTIRQREKLGLTPINILRRTAGNAGLRGRIEFTADSEGVEIGTNLYYAKYLHYGVPGRMPARPIFPENEFPPEVLEDIADAYQRFVSRLVNQ